MAEDRLEAKDARVLLLWVLAGVVGAAVAFQYFFVAFPEAAVDFRVSRPAAVERARSFLAAQGHRLEGYESSIVFQVDSNAKTYLERELGLEHANSLMGAGDPATGVNVWYWQVRFFRPRQKEEFSVQVDPAGRIVGMSHVIEEAREGARLEKDAARARAEAFLRQRVQVPLEAHDFLPEEANSTERPKRLDWSFTWERRGFKAKDAPYRLKVTLHGDAVGGYHEFLKVPEAWERDFERLRSSNFFYQYAAQVPFAFLQGGVFVVLYDLARRGQVRWRGALKLGLVLASLFFVMEANAWPLARAGYDTNSSYEGFFFSRLVLAALGSLLVGMVVSLTVAAAEPLYRKDYGEKLSLGVMASRAGLRSKEFFRSCVIGLAMAAAHIGFVVAFYVVGRQFGFWTPQDIKYTDAVSTALPWIYPLAISLYAATSEEFLFRLFAIPLLLRLTKSKFLAIVVPAFIWGFLHSAYPVQPGYARGIEVGLIGIVAGWVMIRWGILATLVWHYTVDALLIGLFLLRSESLYFRLSGALVSAAVVLPLVVAGGAYLYRRRFADAEPLLNRSQPEVLAPVEVAAQPEAARAPVYEGVSRSTLGVAVAAGALGVLLVAGVKIEPLGNFIRFQTTPRQAAERADAVLRQRKADPSRYRRAVHFVPTFNSYANEYLRRQVGIEGANRLYEKKAPSAFWRVRYFRDSEKEEYGVVLRLDGSLHAVHHLLEEKASGPNLSKEEALARAEVYLRDEKKLDLARWKLVESTSDKRPARSDHTFVWEELEATGEAHVRAELKVQGEEVSGYRVFVKIPEEWERRQKEETAASIAHTVARIVLIAGLAVTVLVLFFKNLRQQHVPWRRLARWAIWGGLATLVSTANAWPLLLVNYPTEFPLKTFVAILVMVQFLLLAIVFSGLFFLFGLAWFFLARAFGEERLPAWRGMPAAYYRHAVLLALAGAGFLLGLGRVRHMVEQVWPTLKESVSASLPSGFDTFLPAATFIPGGVTTGLLAVGLLGLAAAFVARYMRQPWMRLVAVALVAVALVGDWGSPADFAKSALLAMLNLGVVWWGVTRLFRFNMLAYFLLAATLSLTASAAQLLRQPNSYYHLNGYVVIAAVLLLLAWPLLAARSAPPDGAAPSGFSGSAGATGPPVPGVEPGWPPPPASPGNGSSGRPS